MAVILFHSDRMAALEWLEKAALQGHRKSCRTIKQLYSQDIEACFFEESGCDGVIHIYNAVEEVCQDIQLASIPYVPAVEKYGIFSFSSSPLEFRLNKELQRGEGVSGAPLYSSDQAGEWFIGNDKDKGYDFPSSLPMIRANKAGDRE